MAKKTSQEYLAESVLELLSKYHGERITVVQIAQNCNISTRTFYNYFQDKHDLYLWVYVRYLEEFFEITEEQITFSSFMHYTGDVVWRHFDFFIHVIEDNGQNNFINSVFQPLDELYKRIIEEYYGDPITQEMEENLSFFICGMIEYAKRSVTSSHPQDVDSAVVIFKNSIPDNLKKYL